MKHEDLAIHLKNHYNIIADEIVLHREMIGKVFFSKAGEKKFVVKIYRKMYEDNALQTEKILEYLENEEYSAVRMHKSVNNGYLSYFENNGEKCPCIVFQFVEGEEPDEKRDAATIGYQLANLHATMGKYSGEIKNRDEYEYLLGFIGYMKEKGLYASKIDDLEKYGSQLWESMNRLPKYFCHGDFHTGNMIRDKTQQIVFFDFDDMSGDWPIMDMAYLSDVTNFNKFDGSMFKDVERQFENIYLGYGKKIQINKKEYLGIFDFIAVRHYQILSRIIQCQGLECISLETCNEQHDWLMKWRNGCQKMQ